MFREEAGRLTASLVRALGDFDLAEEMVAEAVVEALTRWPVHGAPDHPGAWLLTTARRKAIDRLRRQGRYEDKLRLVAALPPSPPREPDDRLRLIFTCCHPALAPAARVALTLRAVVGLSTAEIARAFLVPEPTLAKRLTRAKQKIVTAGIRYDVPGPDELATRLPSVLQVVYLLLNEGSLSTGAGGVRRELVEDAEWLAGQLAALLPGEPEPLALLALVGFQLARWPARTAGDGRLLVLAEQDRARWDQRRIALARSHLERAARSGRTGPYQIEAAIAAVHCDAPSWASTDWAQLLVLYSMLQALDPSPLVTLNRAVVVGEVGGAAAALAEVEPLAGRLGGYHLFHAVRASLLRRLGRDGEARDADATALSLTANPAEQHLLASRLGAATTLAATAIDAPGGAST